MTLLLCYIVPWTCPSLLFLFTLQGKHPCSRGFYGTSPKNLPLFFIAKNDSGGRQSKVFAYFFYRCTSKSTKHIGSLFLVMVHWCFFIGLEAPMLHDPCTPMIFWPKNHMCSTFVMVHHCTSLIIVHQNRCFPLLWVHWLLVLYLVKMHQFSL